MTLALAFISWIGSVYGMGEVQSLLSAEGIRWILGHVVENYVKTPALGIVLILFMGVGIGLRAGMYDAMRRFGGKGRPLSRKERRALALSTFTLILYISLVGVSVLLPWNFLLGVTGSLLHSPFAEGLVFVLSLGVGLSGIVYGYVADVFQRVVDVLDGMSCLIARYASYFVALFFVVQFFSALTYTRLDVWMGLSEVWMTMVQHFFCYVPLVVSFCMPIYNN